MKKMIGFLMAMLVLVCGVLCAQASTLSETQYAWFGGTRQYPEIYGLKLGMDREEVQKYAETIGEIVSDAPGVKVEGFDLFEDDFEEYEPEASSDTEWETMVFDGQSMDGYSWIRLGCTLHNGYLVKQEAKLTFSQEEKDEAIECFDTLRAETEGAYGEYTQVSVDDDIEIDMQQERTVLRSLQWIEGNVTCTQKLYFDCEQGFWKVSVLVEMSEE